jgi:hypothetical protein
MNEVELLVEEIQSLSEELDIKIQRLKDDVSIAVTEAEDIANIAESEAHKIDLLKGIKVAISDAIENQETALDLWCE